MTAEAHSFESRSIGAFERAKNPPDASTSEHGSNVADERAVLEARVFKLITYRRNVRIQLGRTFIQLKNLTKHGNWKNYFEQVFATSGMSLRSAERCMKMAAEEEESENDKLSIFKNATDSQAGAIRSATAAAVSEVAAAAKRIIPRKPNFQLPLFLTSEEQWATRRLLKSVNWPSAELEITKCLRRVLVKFSPGHGGSR